MSKESALGAVKASLPLSVFIIAKNEADRIHRAIISVRDWVDEVIVVDSGSTDDTVAVSEALGARVVFHEWPGYGPQKRFAESLCRNSWVLNLDADESASPEAAAEIRALFSGGRPPLDAYMIGLTPLFPFEKKPNAFAVATRQIRLYNKDLFHFRDSTVHDTVYVPAGTKIGRIRGLFPHRSSRSRAHAVNKINAYTSMQAEDHFRKGRRLSVLRLIFTPPLEFLRGYFLRGFVFYGINGFIDAYIYSFARFLRVAKNYERFHSPDPSMDPAATLPARAEANSSERAPFSADIASTERATSVASPLASTSKASPDE